MRSGSLNLDYTKILENIYLSIGLWFFSILSLSLFRVSFLIYFQERLPENNILLDIFTAMFAGVGQDLVVSSTIVIVYLVISKILLVFRKTPFHLINNMGDLFCAVSSFMYVCAIHYFEEFNSHFNFILFQMDAFEAKSLAPILWYDYNIFLNLFVLIVVIYCSRFLLKSLNHTLSHHWPNLKTYKHKISILLSVYLVFLGTPFLVSNTAEGTNIISRESENPFLQKVSQNPLSELMGAFHRFYLSGHASNLEEFLPDNNLYSALNSTYSDAPFSNHLDDYFLKTSQGPLIPAPSHVFFIIMESYSAWLMMPQFKSLNLTDNLKEIGSKGLWVKKFLSSGGGSSTSLSSLLTGLHYAYDTTPLDQPYLTAPAKIFSNLGYSTRFFYGGELVWNSIGKNAKVLGFNEAYGSKDIHQETQAWKVSDYKLFNFVINTIENNSKAPSFNFIFTTSNHPPLTVDLDKEGFPLKKIPDNFLITSSVNSLHRLGHLWYSDQQLGRFVYIVSSRFPDAMFVILGDHPTSNTQPVKPSFLDSKTVPLVIYSKDNPLEDFQSEQLFGSHMDILPTIVELIAPKGFSYHATGNNILKRKPGDIAIGLKSLVTSDFIMDMKYPSTVYPFENSDADNRQNKHDLRNKFNSIIATSWWRSQVGEKINEARH